LTKRRFDDRLNFKISEGSTLFELAFSFALIFILIGVFGLYSSKILLAAREAVLKSELSNLRLSCEVYRIRNGASPGDLGSVCQNQSYFVMIERRDKDGALVDPFGNKYVYSPKDCRIRSGTVKYAGW